MTSTDGRRTEAPADVGHRHGLPRGDRGGNLALPILLLSIAYVAVHGAVISRFPLFVDESIYARFALTVQHDPSQFFVALTDKKGLLVSWLGALLVDAGVTPLTAIRLISSASGLLLLAVVALLGRELYGRTVGLVAGALALVMPFAVVQTTVGTYDSTVAALGASALLLEIRIARSPRITAALLLALVFAAGALTKPSAYVAVALLPVSLLLFDWDSPDKRRRLARWAGCVGIALTGVVAAEVLMRSSDLYFAQGPANYHSLSQVLTHPLTLLQAHWPAVRSSLLGYVTAPLLLLALFGAVAGLLIDAKRMGVLVAWFVVVLIAALLIPYDAYPRYVVPAIPMLAVITAFAITRAWAALSPPQLRIRRAPIAALALLGAALVPALLFDARFVAHPRTAHYPGLDEAGFVSSTTAAAVVVDAAAEIRRRSNPTQPVINVAHFGGYHDPLEFALNGRKGLVRPFFLVTESPPMTVVGSEQFLVVEGPLPPSGVRRLGFQLVGRFARPRGGLPVLLFER